MKKFWFLNFVFFLGINFSFAQELGLRQYPESPKEGEEVKLTLESDKYNLNSAIVTWSIDGKEYDSGVGRTTLIIKTSINGLAQIVTATVEQEGYDKAQIQKVVEANTNFILYEGVDSYIPSFYKGRRLPSKEGTVRVAMFSFKDGEIVDFNRSTNNHYTWRVNGQDKSEISGQNKIINQINTSVTDNTLSLRITKEELNQSRKMSEIIIPLQKTEVIVYKTDEKKLLKQVLEDTEIGKKIFLLVEPFFFSVGDKKDKRLLYTWKINDIETKILTPWSVVFSGKEKDSVKINLDIINNQKITQENNKGFTFRVE